MFPELLMIAEAVRPAKGGANPFSRWLSDPKHTVLIVLGVAIVIGGGRKWLEARRATRLKERLQGPEPSEGEILEASKHGREALPELFALLDPAMDADRRQAAGRALARLWAQDQLVGEEERALVVRGFRVDWRARKRYPRGLNVPIPVSVQFGVPFLGEDDDDEAIVCERQLEWSCRVTGSGRASLERFSDWQAGQSERVFSVNPQDFSGPGPHRLVFQARVRTTGLTSSWDLELPHVPFSIEFDPNLEVDALRALPDDERGKVVRASVRLIQTQDEGEPRFLPIHEELVIRNPPVLEVGPRPSDLAHVLEVEFEGIETRLPAGFLVATADETGKTVPLVFEAGLPASLLERPGEYRLRVRLTPDSHRGWADPGVRSIWPEAVETDWVAVQVIRS